MSELTEILLVDDNPKYLANILPLYGCNVCCATNCTQALESLRTDKIFDLILLDISMQDMKGLELLKILKKTPVLKDIPIIILTAVKDDKKMVSCLKIGADDYIIKPFILPNLLARTEAVLRRTKHFRAKIKSHNVTISQTNKFNSLTKREKDVLLLVTQGESNKSVAEKLVLSEITVKSHLNNIFKKLNVTNRTQAVLLAMQTKLAQEK